MEGSFKNKDTLPDVCSCYYCCSTFNKTEIKYYMDDGKTVQCPYCEIDSVIPQKTNKELKELKKYWFS
jgi:hypothetical protein